MEGNVGQSIGKACTKGNRYHLLRYLLFFCIAVNVYVSWSLLSMGARCSILHSIESDRHAVSVLLRHKENLELINVLRVFGAPTFSRLESDGKVLSLVYLAPLNPIVAEDSIFLYFECENGLIAKHNLQEYSDFLEQRMGL